MPQTLESFLTTAVNVVASLAVVIIVMPLIVFAIVPLTCVYEYVRRRYVTTSRELKRLDSIAMAPIFGSFSETLQVVYLILFIFISFIFQV